MGMDDDVSTLYSRVNTMDVRLKEVETIQPFLKDMLERNTATAEKLSDTLNNMRISMESMNTKIELQSTELKKAKDELIETTSTLNDKIAQIDHKVDNLEDKGKFDIHEFIKKNWPWIIVVLGVGFMAVSNFVKF